MKAHNYDSIISGVLAISGFIENHAGLVTTAMKNTCKCAQSHLIVQC